MRRAHTIVHGCGHLEIVDPPEQILTCSLNLQNPAPSSPSPNSLTTLRFCPSENLSFVQTFSFFACTGCIEKLKREFLPTKKCRSRTSSSGVLDEPTYNSNIKNNSKETFATPSDDMNNSGPEDTRQSESSLVNIIEGFDPTVAFLSPLTPISICGGSVCDGGFFGDDGGGGCTEPGVAGLKEGRGGRDDKPTVDSDNELEKSRPDTAVAYPTSPQRHRRMSCAMGSLYTQSLSDEGDWCIVRADVAASFGEAKSVVLGPQSYLDVKELQDKQSGCRVTDRASYKIPLIIPRIFRMLHLV